MKRIVMYHADVADLDLLYLLPHAIASNPENQKVLNKIKNRQPVYREELTAYRQLFSEAEKVYREYAEQKLPVGGLILNQEAADGVIANWTALAECARSYAASLSLAMNW